MKKSPSGKARSRLDSQQIPRFLPNSKVHCHAHDSLSLTATLSEMNKLRTLRLHFNSTLQY
jgi:hypothetical protein